MKHQITLYEAGMMIVGRNHNPSILNPDFLWRHGIVPEDLEIAENVPSISTPMTSQCIFKNNLEIVSEPNRVSFIQKNISNENDSDISLCYQAGRKYLRTVPLVPYTAVGINFIASFPVPNGSLSLRNMMRPGEWNRFEDISPTTEIVLTYPLPGRIVNLTIGSDDSVSKEKVFVRGNFHRDIKAEQGESHQVAMAIAGDWENDLGCFKNLIETIAKGTVTE